MRVGIIMWVRERENIGTKWCSTMVVVATLLYQISTRRFTIGYQVWLFLLVFPVNFKSRFNVPAAPNPCSAATDKKGTVVNNVIAATKNVLVVVRYVMVILIFVQLLAPPSPNIRVVMATTTTTTAVPTETRSIIYLSSSFWLFVRYFEFSRTFFASKLRLSTRGTMDATILTLQVCSL